MRNLTIVTALSCVCLSCTSTSRFSTSAGESYCGVVTSASFVRSPGIEPGTMMRLLLDADSLQDQPGQLWTGALLPGVGDKAGPGFSGQTLRAIPQLVNDPLSTLTFGEGNVMSTIAIAEFQRTDVMVVISMLQTGNVDVRLIRGDGRSSWDDGTPKPPQIFGVFHLTKQPGDCGLPLHP
jgi:hypothetical protein